jgi:hypothetical protein
MLFPRPPADGSQEADKNEILQKYQQRMATGNLLLRNLVGALRVASDTSEPVAKKAKMEQVTVPRGDVYNILDPSFSKQNNTVSEGEGAILSRLTLGGLVNALAGVNGGVVDTVTCVPLSDLKNSDANAAAMNGDVIANGEKNGLDDVVETAGNLTLKELIRIGSGLHRSVSAR